MKRLPEPGVATLLPDPHEAYAAYVAHFYESRGVRPRPWTLPDDASVDEVRELANLITFALRNDLSSVAASDAAAIWEAWRQTTLQVDGYLRDLDDKRATIISSDAVWNAAIRLDQGGRDVVTALAKAFARRTGTTTRNDAGDRFQFKIRYRGPKGGDFVTHQLGPDYLTALQSAAFSLGFWPAVLNAYRLDGNTWRSV